MIVIPLQRASVLSLLLTRGRLSILLARTSGDLIIITTLEFREGSSDVWGLAHMVFFYRDFTVEEMERTVRFHYLDACRSFSDLVFLFKIIIGVLDCSGLLVFIDSRVPSSNSPSEPFFL